MSTALKELQERKNEIGQRITELGKKSNDADYEWRQEDEENWKAANKDYDLIKGQLDRAMKLKEIEEEARRAQEPRDTELTRKLEQRGSGGQVGGQGRERAQKPRWQESIEQRQARIEKGDMTPYEFSAALLQGMLIQRSARSDLLRAEHHHAFKHFKLAPGADSFEANLFDGNYHIYRSLLLAEQVHGPQELRAMGLTPGAGEEWTDEEWVRTLEKTMLWSGPMWQVSDVRTTASGSALHYPTTDDTSNEAVIVGQATDPGDQDVVTDEMVLTSFKYTSKFIYVNEELMEDSIFNMATELAEIIGARLGRGTNRDFTVGVGTTTPFGVVTRAASVLTGAIGTMAAGDWMDLEHGVDKSYRPGSRFMMHDTVVLAVRKLENADGDFIYQQGLQLGQPDRLLGYPLEVNNHMASTITPGDYIGLFGLFSKYKIRRVRGLRMHTLVERFRDLDQTGFIGYLRTDGDLVQPAAMRRLEVRST